MKKINTYGLGIALIILGFIFQPIIQGKLNIFQWYDEIIAILLFARFILYVITGKMRKLLKSELYCLLLMALLVGEGIISNFTANIVTGWKTIVIDIITNLKIYMIYLGVLSFKKRDNNKKDIINITNWFIRKIVYIATIFAIINLFHNIGMSSDIRFGIRSFKFIYEGAGNFNMMCYYFIALLTLGIEDKRNKLSLLCTLFLWASTLRTRAFLYIFIYIFLYFMIFKKVNLSEEMKKKAKPIIVVCSIALIIIGTYTIIGEQVEYYFGNDRMPRAILLKYGVKTMEEYFPIGSGFSTYGSSEASKNYSPLYWEYGFNDGYGINYGDRQYLSDNYWPSIMAQFGVIGCIIVILLIINLIKSVIRRNKDNKVTFFASLMILICVICASLATSSMVHYTTVGLFFILGIASSYLGENNEDN